MLSEYPLSTQHSAESVMLQYSQQSIRSITLSPLHSPSKSIVATSFIIPLQLSQLLNLHCKYLLTLGDTEFSICTNTYFMWMTAGMAVEPMVGGVVQRPPWFLLIIIPVLDKSILVLDYPHIGCFLGC